MQVTQIFLTDRDEELSPFLTDAVQSVQDAFPDLPHKIYTNADVIEFLEEHYDKEVLDAYLKFKPYSYRCDLARYCIADVLGGWYFDISIRCTGGIQVADDVDLLAFRDMNQYTRVSWACDGGVFFTRAGNGILANAIDLICDNAAAEYYGRTPLCPTGPTVWGKAIAMDDMDYNVVFGDVMELTPHHTNRNKALVLPNGTIFAHKKPSAGGDLTGIGAKGVNNYNNFWMNRDVYNK